MNKTTLHTQLLIATLAVSTLAAGATLGVAITRPAVLPPCAEEDSTNCFWDAGTSGNGIGTDFIDFNGQVYYPVK